MEDVRRVAENKILNNGGVGGVEGVGGGVAALDFNALDLSGMFQCFLAWVKPTNIRMCRTHTTQNQTMLLSLADEQM